ncbi:MAG: hypothetical protein IJX17_05410 [Clostridia bacterium]|nr:hypothetical protein [Clostridia bacterium]
MAKNKTFESWFESQSRLIQIILLLIPVVNWVTEALVRWSHALRTKSLLKYVLAILVTIPSGILFGLIDVVWTLLFKHLLFCN